MSGTAKSYNYLIHLSSIAIFITFPVYKTFFIGSHYSPLSMIPLVFVGALSLFVKLFRTSRVRREEGIILLIGLYLTTASVLAYIYFDNDISFPEIVTGLIPIYVAILSLFGYGIVFRSGFFNFSFKLLRTSGDIVIIYGLIELAALMGILPSSIRELVISITSGTVSGRLQLLTPEASWASGYLIFIAPLYFIDVNNSLKNIFFKASLLLLLIVSFSLWGISILLVSFFLYSLFLSKKPLSLVLKIFSLFLVAAILINVSLYLINTYLGDDLPYYLSRIVKIASMSQASFIDIISLDGSVFVRIMYPVYAVIIAVTHPLGVSPGQYPFIFNEMLPHFPYHDIALSNVEILGDISTVTADPRGLFTALFAHGGFICLFLFLYYLKLIYSRLKQINSSTTKKILAYQLFTCIGAFLQFGSYAYLPFWLVSAAIIYCSSQNQKTYPTRNAAEGRTHV